MKKIIINESQFKRLILEVEGPDDEKGEEETEEVASIETPEGEKEEVEGDIPDVVLQAKEGSADDYIDNQWLEGVVVTWDKKNKEVTVDADPWKYKHGKKTYNQKRNWYKAKDADTTGLRRKINKFASRYIEHMAKNIDLAVGPVITSGYRGPKKQIAAMYNQWKGDKDYIKNTYRRSYKEMGKIIEDYFTQYDAGPAKRAAAKFLRKKEKEKKYISNHQRRGAIDISLFNDKPKNDEIKTFLDTAQDNKWISSYVDEREYDAGPHFHIKLA